MAGFNDDLGMDRSYYAATANAAPQARPLTGAHTADVVVVGGGCTGLAAARRLALRGQSVILLEGGRIGWGASGRNGGQVIPGLRSGAQDLVRLYGEARARRIFDLAIAARDEVVALIAKENIDCDLKLTGHLTAAVREADMPGLEAEAHCLKAVMGYPGTEILDRTAVRAEVAHDYAGGLLDRLGGHLHPLNYTLGLAQAAARAGAVLRSHSAADSIDVVNDVAVVKTADGEVRARACVLAGDALLGQVDRRIAKHIMPVANYIAATAPLDNPSALIANDRAISDSKFIVNYYRLSADGRLIFGGGERYTTAPPADMAGFVRPFLEAAFPQLRGVAIDYAWGGLVSITRTRLPHMGRRGPIYWAHGYSGMGTILSTLAGRLMADAICGEPAGLDVFASIAPPAFPGGTLLRSPLHTLAMVFFAARDRLGL